ncbi:hypothetical protein GF380_00940 [Candidatus Uhrbacteria bacterium]|nr:hypothetical protein [Candidatus Uhrbacteria bacterium]
MVIAARSRSSSAMMLGAFIIVAIMALLLLINSVPGGVVVDDKTTPVYQPGVAEIEIPGNMRAPVLAKEDKATVEEVASVKTDDLDITVSHGTTKHPFEANEIRKCLDERGALMIFKLGPQYARICDLGPKNVGSTGRWFGFQVIGRSANGWFESTAYVPKLADATLWGLLKWIEKAGWTRFGK